MEKVCNFLKEAGVYYLATVEGDQPRVRPFGTADIFDGNTQVLYLANATATFSSFTAAPEVIKF